MILLYDDNCIIVSLTNHNWRLINLDLIIEFMVAQVHGQLSLYDLCNAKLILLLHYVPEDSKENHVSILNIFKRPFSTKCDLTGAYYKIAILNAAHVSLRYCKTLSREYCSYPSKWALFFLTFYSEYKNIFLQAFAEPFEFIDFLTVIRHEKAYVLITWIKSI